MPRWDHDDIVPRQMLEISKDLLRRCLADRIELQNQLKRAYAEIARLKRRHHRD